MVWSNWQGAIWRGAMLVVLFWSGLAWTQTTPPASDAPERIMVVHANGKSTRCRVLQSWKLDDGRIAHLLQAVENNEKITIVDESAPQGGPAAGTSRGMPKRIFTWGVGGETPPEGSPVPPTTQIVLPAVGALSGAPSADPLILNKEEKHPAGIEVSVETETKPTPKQVIDFKDAPKGAPLTPPSILNAQPTGIDNLPKPLPSELPKLEETSSKPMFMESKGSSLGESGLGGKALPGANTSARMEPPLSAPSGPVVVAPMPGAPGSTGSPIVIHEGAARRGWRPGDVLLSRSNQPSTPTITYRQEDFLTTENKIAEKRIADRNDKMPKAPLSTAMSSPSDVKKPAPIVLESKPAASSNASMWGAVASEKIQSPGKTLVNNDVVQLPAPPIGRTNDPLYAPEKLIPNDVHSRPTMLPPVEVVEPRGWPVGMQSVNAARSGLQGPMTYVPVPTVTVPQPNHPPVPPTPSLPEPPQLNAYVNAFSPAPSPKPAPPTAASIPQWMQPNPAMVQQQQMMQQQLMQQHMLQQQILMAHGYRPNPNMMQGYMPQGAPSQGPMTNGSPMYAGPMPPQNPFAPPMMPTMPTMPMAQVQPVNYQAPMPQPTMNQQIEQMIKLMRESPYPSQREVAAQSLANFDWKAHPHIVPALLQGASQDPAASVRAGCVSCLGRMGAALEPVMTTLQTMRNDIDPRVRQEVEQALGRLAQQ